MRIAVRCRIATPFGDLFCASVRRVNSLLREGISIDWTSVNEVREGMWADVFADWPPELRQAVIELCMALIPIRRRLQNRRTGQGARVSSGYAILLQSGDDAPDGRRPCPERLHTVSCVGGAARMLPDRAGRGWRRAHAAGSCRARVAPRACCRIVPGAGAARAPRSRGWAVGYVMARARTQSWDSTPTSRQPKNLSQSHLDFV